MIEPTLNDFERRLSRVLVELLHGAGKDRAQLTREGAAYNLSPGTSSGFRLQEEELAREWFVRLMEAALTELKRTIERTTLDPAELRLTAGRQIAEKLDEIVAVALPTVSHPLPARPPTNLPARLRELMEEVLYEFDRGLYALPGDPSGDVTINVANVYESRVGELQQAGRSASQRGGPKG